MRKASKISSCQLLDGNWILISLAVEKENAAVAREKRQTEEIYRTENYRMRSRRLAGG